MEDAQFWVSVVDPNQMAQMTIEERKRQEAIFELILTEQNFVRDMQLVIEV